MNIQSLTIFRLLLVIVVLLAGGRSLHAQTPNNIRKVKTNDPKTFKVESLPTHSVEQYLWEINEWDETSKTVKPGNLLTEAQQNEALTRSLQYTFTKEGMYKVTLRKQEGHVIEYPSELPDYHFSCPGDPVVMWIQAFDTDPTDFKFSDFYTLGFCEDKTKLTLSSSTDDPDCTWRWEPAQYFDNPDVREPYFMRHTDFTKGDQVEVTCKVTHTSGVFTIDTAYINIEEDLQIQISYDQEYLYSENSHLIKVTANKSNVVAASVRWETVDKDIKPGTTALSDVSRYIIYEPGTYRCTVTDLSGCEATTEVRFDDIFWRAPEAENDFVIAKDRKQILIDVLANDTDWNNNIDPSTLHITNEPKHGLVVLNEDNTVTYNLTVAYEQSDEFSYEICDYTNLCSTARVLIFFESTPINLPEGISPLNNDGINDKFIMIGINYFDKKQLVIFDRWGEKVYASDNYGAEEYGGDGWWSGEINSGIRKGQKVTEGTYYYILKLDSHSPIKGSITIR